MNCKKKRPSYVVLWITVMVIGVLALAVRANALVLYGASAAGSPGELYILNPATGAIVQDIGPLNDSGSTNYGITGLAFHPTSRVLYGSTANNIVATRAKLVTINTNTGLVTVIGSYNLATGTMADIAFDASGNLWGVSSAGGARLFSINIATGQATLVGSSGLTGTSGGGLAISSAGVFYSTPTASRFGTFNPTTGAYTDIGNPAKPLGGAYAALAFDDSGVLYGLNLGPDAILTHLVTIDPATAAVTDIGASANALDAIAFQPAPVPTVVSVNASVATANEQGPVNGVFTMTRTGDTSAPLAVNYTLSGTATNGADYTILPGSVTFQPGASSTNITVVVNDDAIPEATATVILTITASVNYGIGNLSATVSILDNEPTEVALALTAQEDRLLEGFDGSKVSFQLSRRGTNTSALTVNLGYSGVANRGADFNGPSAVVIGANVATTNFNLTPINDAAYEGSETANISVVPGAGYNIPSDNSASATIVDDESPSGAIIFADDFETNSAVRWITNSADGGTDSAADFAYDYSQLHVPPAPGGTSTLGLRFRLNETSGALNAVSASPLDLNLTDDFRLKFNMWINYNGPMFDGGSGSTMHFTAGVGTTADHANLATSALSDGIWFGASGDGGSTLATGDVDAYAATTLFNDDSTVYAAGTGPANGGIRRTTHPYYALWGNVPAPAAQLASFPSQTGTSGRGNLGVSWHTVVITKATNVVTWVIDGILIATVPVDSTPLSTNVFVGFQDLFPGVSGTPAMSFVVVDNLRVESFAAAPISISIAEIKIVGGSVEIIFNGPATSQASEFKLQSSTVVTGTYADDNSAVILALGPGSFKATSAANGTNSFYRIKR